MLFFNNKTGNITNYYNNLFISYWKCFTILDSNIYKKQILRCVLTYSIWNKKVSLFKFSSNIIKKRNMKTNLNLNQVVILECTLSRNKCLLTVPVTSFVHYMSGY